MVNSRRAMAECLEAALDEGDTDCDLVVIHASMGHDYQDLIDEARLMAPGARVVGCSCCDIIGREGVSESMKDVAIMAVRGAAEIAVAHVDGIFGHNSFEKSAELAAALKAANPAVNMIYFLASGIDIADDRCIAGIESVFGPEVTIFGATSADNMNWTAARPGRPSPPAWNCRSRRPAATPSPSAPWRRPCPRTWRPSMATTTYCG